MTEITKSGPSFANFLKPENMLWLLCYKRILDLTTIPGLSISGSHQDRASGAEVPQSGSKGGGRSLLGSLRVQKGPLRVLAKILQSQCDGQSRALHSARFMWSKWCEIIHHQGLERPRRELRKTQGLSTSGGPSGSFGVPQSRGVESLIRGSFKWSWLAPSTSQGMTLLTEISV